MWWPILRAVFEGELTLAQLDRLRDAFGLDAGPRTEGPGAGASLAHRRFTDETGADLVVDLSRLAPDAWVLALFQPLEGLQAGGGAPKATLETYRARFRRAAEELGLTLAGIEPAATADEVAVPSPLPSEVASSSGAHWDLPDDLEAVWFRLGMTADSPQEVKEVQLRSLMRSRAWDQAPEQVRRQAAAFLQADG